MFKKRFLSLCFTLVSLSVVAQLKQGRIFYERTTLVSNPEGKTVPFLMPMDTTIFSFCPGFCKSNGTNDDMFESPFYFNTESRQTWAFLNLFVKKFIIEAPIDSVKHVDTNSTIVLTQETQVICGYNCTKVIFTEPSENSISYLWVTNEIEAINFLAPPVYLLKPELGFVMMFRTHKAPFIYEYIPKLVETTVDRSVFDLTNPEGYEIIKPNELSRKIMEQ